MRHLIVSIYDAAATTFSLPMYMVTKGAAVRSFSDAVGDDKSPFCAHPEDYTLFALGTFDDTSGEFVTLSAPEKVITAVECVDRSS